MKNLQEYIVNEGIVNEGLKDSFINVFKKLFGLHDSLSSENSITIEVDSKTFGKFNRDENYFSNKTNKKYPKLIPIPYEEDLWELYLLEMNENKYGDDEGTYTFIGQADFQYEGNIGKISVYKDYEELVTKIFEKYK